MRERRAAGLILLSLAAAGTSGPARAVETEGVLSRERPVRVIAGPHGYRGARPPAKEDPVPPLGEGDLDLFKGGLASAEVKQILDGYLDRMLATYAGARGFPGELVEFLKSDRGAAEVFVTALDPVYDDVGAAGAVFESLRQADAKLLRKYVHLATALAVVYDTPDAVPTSRYLALWGVEASQFGGLPNVSEIWEYYTDPKLAARFGFALDKLPWPILVHLVDNDVEKDDRNWSLSKYSGRTANVARLYPSVKYDYEKMNRRASKLGKNPYTLPNLLKYGGVCVDQAHFASRVAKCIGVPAMKVTGHGRFGGAGHAWTGYLVIQKGRPLLEFTGRYFLDYYYTGDIYDPQTRTMTLDRFVAMMYDGASLSYPKYNQSQMLVRMAERIRAERPAESLELVQEALKLNYFNMWAWPLLVDFIADATLDKQDGLKWFNKMLKGLADHPDMTYHCLGAFMGCIPEEKTVQRQSLYNQAARLYGERPDLLIKLRLEQAEELCRAGDKRSALSILMPTVVENSKEGSLVLPAMRRSVELATELELQRAAHNILKNADKDFPKRRGTQPSEAYADFKALLESLR